MTETFELYYLVREMVGIAFKTIIPWKKNNGVAFKDDRAYAQGWNDCLREIKKNRKKWLDRYNSLDPRNYRLHK